ADLGEGCGEVLVVCAVDRDAARGGAVEADDHAHRGGLACPVGSEESCDASRAHREGYVVHGDLVSVPLAEALCCDHVLDATGAGGTGASVCRMNLVFTAMAPWCHAVAGRPPTGR